MSDDRKIYKKDLHLFRPPPFQVIAFLDLRLSRLVFWTVLTRLCRFLQSPRFPFRSQPPNSLLRRSRAGLKKPLQKALVIREKANSQTISRTSKGEREPGSITESLYKGMSYPPTSELSQFREVSPATWIMVIDGSLVFRLAVKAHLRFSAYFEQSAKFFYKPLQARRSSHSRGKATMYGCILYRTQQIKIPQRMQV